MELQNKNAMTFLYDSGCEMIDAAPTPGKWNGIVFTAKNGTKWTFDPAGPDPRQDDTGVHTLIPVQVPVIFETNDIESPAPMCFQHGPNDPVCSCEMPKVRCPHASECMTCKRMVPMHDRFWNYVRPGTKLRHPHDGVYSIISVNPNDADTDDGETKTRLYIADSEVVK